MKAEFFDEPKERVKLVTQGNKIFVFISLNPEKYLEQTNYSIPTYAERIEALESAVYEIAGVLYNG